MKLSKRIYYRGCSLLPSGMLKKIVQPGTLFPYHHLVDDGDVLHVKHLYTYKNRKQFQEDLDHLLKHLQPVSAEAVAAAVLGGRSLPRNAFLLTFDDGFRQVYDTIAPILSAKGVPAIFFVNPAFLDNRVLFYRCKISLVIEAILQRQEQPGLLKEVAGIVGEEQAESGVLVQRIRRINNVDAGLLDRLADPLELSYEAYLETVRPFMTGEQVKELRGKGFAVGAHSWDHPYYPLISPEEQQWQTRESVRYVCEQYAPGHALFSFPHSDEELPQSFFDSCGKTADVFFGIQNQKKETANRVLHRWNAERPALPMSRQLNGVLLWMLVQKLSRRDRVVRS